MFRRPPPPIWYVLHPSDNTSKPPRREGPYKRATISYLLAHGQLPSSALIWTNEKIWPNPEKPRSSRPIRIPDWRRLDQLPDPIVQQLQQEAARLKSNPDPQHTATTTHTSSPNNSADAPPPIPSTPEMNRLLQADSTNPPFNSYPPNTAPVSPSSTPASPSPYPVGNLTTPGGGIYPAGAEIAMQATAPGTSSAYPQPGAYPQARPPSNPTSPQP